MSRKFKRNSYLKYGDIMRTRILIIKLKMRYYKLFEHVKIYIDYDKKSDSHIQIYQQIKRGLKRYSAQIIIAPNQLFNLSTEMHNVIKEDAKIKNKSKIKCSHLEFVLLHELGHWVDFINDVIEYERNDEIQIKLEEMLTSLMENGLISYEKSCISYSHFILEERANKIALLLLERKL